MTKTQTKSRRVPIYRRPITIIICLILIIALVVIIFLLCRSAQTTADDSTPVDESQVTDASTIDLDDPVNAENPPDKSIQYEGENPNQLDELTGSITRRSISRGTLTVVASIDQYLSSDSSCRLVLKDASGTEVSNVYSLPVEAEATSSACGPFTVPVSQLSGTYTIDITIVSPDKSGHIITDINI